ncbi:LAME_0H05732g1_1 [Lachancea meyersii CBS 8951]|uniref:LAME_0H05732g1_1 n=1 Tax=Lachancea meyersii CBS 8951 TaxID=1266667 RepID=A0A1G4KEC9_9SACH|nr:LAME_0H05732g1_1 [Lachancea meyersii CBS 8951]
MSAHKVLLVGISGCSSSGKTTLAKLITSLLPSAVLLHEDDFFKHDEDIPYDEKYQVSNWDSPDALDLALFRKELDYIKETGTISTELIHNNNHQNSRAVSLDADTQHAIVGKLAAAFKDSNTKVVVVDGFLMYHDAELSKKFDLKVLIRAPYSTLNKRRADRSGYQTLESFWIDPPFYFDEFVYKSYSECHAHLFEDDNVEGTLKENCGVHDYMNDDNAKIGEALLWLCDLIVSLR